ncbi:ABC transporter permease [Rhodobacterales bacterium HKCCSP123]|nr:ABC transporter permease [Rhodobacterales bacterium HKCCSP123]
MTLRQPETPGIQIRPSRAPRSFPAFRSILALMLREMSTLYGRTPGGYFWAVAQPVGALAVMTVAFTILLRSPPLGNSFILFYASGYLPFLVYANIALSVQNSIQFSKQLLQYPAVSWLDAIIARFLLNLLTSITILCIVLFGILQFTEANATVSPGPIVLSVVLAALVGLGFGTMNCLMTGLFSAWSNLWSIITRPMILIAGVLFVFEQLPDWFQGYLWYTPWIHVTGLARTGVYATYDPAYISIGLVLLWAMIPLFFGLLLLRRFHKDILNR